MSQTRLFDFAEAMEKLDKSGNINSIEQLGDQIQHVWELAQQVEFDDSYQQVDKVIVAGMGGSTIGTHVIQTVFKDELKVPVVVASDYDVPNYVDENTLVIASSYSGNTEETLSAVKDAQQKGAKIAGISSGGKLADFLHEHQYPALVFTPTYNPCGSPRMALGYSVFGQIALFAQAGLLKVTEEDYQQVLQTIAEGQLTSSRHVPQEENPAKLLAFNLLERIPVITVAEHLEGPAHVFANQIHENSKTYASYRVIPEFNHFGLEGLQHPVSNRDNLMFFVIHSDLYKENNQHRLKLTEEAVTQNHIEYVHQTLTGPTKLAQAFELILLGSYTSYYLAILNQVDPTPNPWVDWFKQQLA